MDFSWLLVFSLMIINKDVKSHVCCVSFFNKNIVITIINFFSMSEARWNNQFAFALQINLLLLVLLNSAKLFCKTRSQTTN